MDSEMKQQLPTTFPLFNTVSLKLAGLKPILDQEMSFTMPWAHFPGTNNELYSVHFIDKKTFITALVNNLFFPDKPSCF